MYKRSYENKSINLGLYVLCQNCTNKVDMNTCLGCNDYENYIPISEEQTHAKNIKEITNNDVV
jgi:hypothetical protein